MHPGKIVLQAEVGESGLGRPRRAAEIAQPINLDRRDAGRIRPTVSAVILLVSEAVSGPHPGCAGGNDIVVHPKRIELELVNQAGAEYGGVGQLRAASRPEFRGRRNRQLTRIAAERIAQLVSVLQPAHIEAVPVAHAVIGAHQVFPRVERVVSLEGRITAGGRIVVHRGLLLHGVVHVGGGPSVRRHQESDVLVGERRGGPRIVDLAAGAEVSRPLRLWSGWRSGPARPSGG